MIAHLDRIEGETAKLNQVLGQLLTLSSIEAVEKTGNFHPVSLRELVRSLISDAQYEAQQHHCSVVF